MNPFGLKLPERSVSDRFSRTGPLPAMTRQTWAEFDGPGCIRHLWVTLRQPRFCPGGGRRIVMRIYFDDAATPNVEAPVSDFFGVMNGLDFYPVNTPWLSVQSVSGYNCYLPMPFARSARIEFETGPDAQVLYCQADWHRYPDAALEEPMRFCARWRREMPTERYGEDFLVLDADGPGTLAGFAYGVRLIDNEDRWSHGGADNTYIDGQGRRPAYLRGIGGEDTFGTSYGGALHAPETHLHAGMPYYIHEDVGEARPAQRLAGYRFFGQDCVDFEESIHVRFGSMRNDICSTAYWYQRTPVRPFFKMPEWPLIVAGKELPRGTSDLPLPDAGAWQLCGPFGMKGAETELAAEREFNAAATFDGLHEENSPWLSPGSRQLGRDTARWVRRASNHGFIDFNHVFRPAVRGVGVHHDGVALARAVLRAPEDLEADVRLAWDDGMTVRVNGQRPIDLGRHAAFRSREVRLPLRKGDNTIVLRLTNSRGGNHGGWAFAFAARTPDGRVLLPQA